MLRKIKTQAEIDRGKRRNGIIIGVIMIGILVVSSLGFALMSGNKKKDNSNVNEFGIEFFKENGLWIADFDGEIFRFQNLPSEVSNVDVNVSFDLERYSGQPLYFVNPNEGASEILNNIGRYILRYQDACLQQDSEIRREGEDNDLNNLSNGDEYICNGDLPVKSCENNLIVFETGASLQRSSLLDSINLTSNETRVYQNESCIFIVGDGVRGVDAFLYEVLGVN